MRRLFTALGLTLTLTLPATAQVAPDPEPAPQPASETPGAASLPELPPSLELDMARDRSGDAVEGRSLTDTAMANASAAYMVGDYQGALIHAERAAAGGEARGATLAGHIRLHGLAGDADDAAAVRWLRRAAELGEPDALVILARLAQSERGGLASWQTREFLAQAAEAGDARAAHEYGLWLIEAGDPGAASQAIDWLRLAAESGREAAFGDYAFALGEWTHGPNDLAAARAWYERAAEAGDGVSALFAGLMFMNGEGGDPDPIRGAQLIQIGAELGLPAAMGQHALLLFQGGVIAPDPVRAADWARRGAEAGDADSQFLFAYALATGDGVGRNLERAYYWVLRAGAPRPDGPVDDVDRDRLEAALERALEGPTRDRLQAEALADARPF